MYPLAASIPVGVVGGGLRAVSETIREGAGSLVTLGRDVEFEAGTARKAHVSPVTKYGCFVYAAVFPKGHRATSVGADRPTRVPYFDSVLGGMAELTKEQREFIVRKLAAFYTPRDIAVQLSALFGLRCNENDVTANDPRLAVVDPALFMLFRSERERVLDDPNAASFADQKARLIALSRQAERYESNNQPAEARAVYRQIAEEMGVIGAKGVGKTAAAAPPAAEQVEEIRVTYVDPKAPEPPAVATAPSDEPPAAA